MQDYKSFDLTGMEQSGTGKMGSLQCGNHAPVDEAFNAAATPAISVVIPLFNKQQHIAATLESVLNQSIPVFEIIVIDDGSTDDGALIVEQFTGVRLIRQANAGVSAARNQGISQARGDFVAFIDADDHWLPHFLEEITRLIQRYPSAGVFATGYQFCRGRDSYLDPKIRFRGNENGAGILEDYFGVAARGDLPFMMSSIVVRAEAFKDIGLFPLNEPMGEDQDFFCRAALRSTIAYSPRVLAIYHLAASNRACVNNVPTEECPFSLRVRQWAMAAEHKHLRTSMRDYCAAHIVHLASLNVRGGRFTIARYLLRKDLARRSAARVYWWTLRCMLGQLLARISVSSDTPAAGSGS